MVITRWSGFIFLLLLLTTSMIGCRQVDRITEENGLPLVAWERDLYISGGVLVYATSSGAAREIAGQADEAAAAFLAMSGEEPRQLIYIAVDRNDSLGETMIESGIQGISKISGKSVPEIKSKMFDATNQQGADRIEQQEQMLHAYLGLVPGVLDAPTTRPAYLWSDAVMIPTASRISKNLDIVIKGVMDQQEFGTLKQLMLFPVIAIAKGFAQKILGEIHETVIIGVHAQGREGWPQERIDQLLKDSLQDGELKQLFQENSFQGDDDTST